MSHTDLSYAIDPKRPVRLLPVYIAKPWGQEIWYTGMEARGESKVAVGNGHIPISTYLSHDPQAIAGNQPVLLLKVLDPSPQPVTGDLYFEVHREKQEVYIVTAVDPQAWPSGAGGIRFGMNQDLRRQMGSDQAFRAAYLEAVQRYETIRRAIDEKQQDLSREERTARAKMEAFTHLRQLKVGDVVKVPTWTPHALQHGVRVVEFQTPTYERYIISFAQKVLTQNHWDTEQAVANMHIDPPALEVFDPVQPGVERIATFDDFNVWRINLISSGSITLPTHIPYAVCMSLTPNVRVGNLKLQAEDACFVPAAGIGDCLIAPTPGAGKAQLLVAAPQL